MHMMQSKCEYPYTLRVIVGVCITSSQMDLDSKTSLFKYLIFKSTNIYWNPTIDPLTTNASQQAFPVSENSITLYTISQAKNLGIILYPLLLLTCHIQSIRKSSICKIHSKFDYFSSSVLLIP